MKKLVGKKNRTFKSANNHKIQIYHTKESKWHIVSKGLKEIYSELTPVYQELEQEFETASLIDLEFYERWLNGRY